MLDILGNVFGKGSKKNGKDRPGEGGTSSNTEFTVVNQDPVTGHASIGYPTILTDDMLRSPPPTASSATPVNTSTLTPQSPNLPFSSSGDRGKADTWNSHADNTIKYRSANVMNSPSRQANPMDNVPFVPNPTFDSVRNGASSSTAVDSKDNLLKKSFNSVERIGQYISTPSSSEYNFSLERSVIRETSLMP